MLLVCNVGFNPCESNDLSISFLVITNSIENIFLISSNLFYKNYRDVTKRCIQINYLLFVSIIVLQRQKEDATHGVGFDLIKNSIYWIVNHPVSY